MFKALVIEDDPRKRKAIEECLLSEFELEISQAENIAIAYRMIDVGSWDIIILDMAFDVSRSDGHGIQRDDLAGIEILQFLEEGEVNIPVIVATQHSSFSNPNIGSVQSVEDLELLLQENFSNSYRRLVRVNLTEDTGRWERNLITYCKDLLKK